jgi:hypothetical protein
MLAAGAMLWASLAAPLAHAAPSKSAGNALRQFTGIVTSLDKATLTVEKRGKSPRTVVFTRHAEMKTTGEIDKNARVTVYYRDEGGKSIAHRVVAKTGRSRPASAGS